MNITDIKCPVYAHVMTWFGQPNHMDIGYDSRDPVVIAKQISEMKRLGITGAILSWQGINPKHSHNHTGTLQFMRVAEQMNFPFMIMFDLHEYSSAEDVRFWKDVFLSSPMYIKRKGIPVVQTFDPLSAPALTALPDKIVLQYRNADGINQPKSGGAFAWIDLENGAYTDYFLKMTKPAHDAGKFIMLSICPGMRGAPWNLSNPSFKPLAWKNGQEWQTSLARVPAWAEVVQIATWNDHDEQNAIEGWIQLA
jgi:hypothetical protein